MPPHAAHLPLLVAAAIAAPGAECAATIVPTAPLGVFIEGEPLRFDCGAAAEGRPYRVLDWRERVVAEGTCGAGGALALPSRVPGWYSLALSGGSATDATAFIVVSPETFQGTDEFFGADSAMSWTEPTRLRCPWHGGDMHRALSEAAGRIGLSHVRDRLDRGSVEPQEGARTFDIATFRNAALLASNGIETCTDIDGTPKWADTVWGKIPRDLAAFHGFCRATAKAFADRTRNWEVFNEQDASLAAEPVWDYAAAQKAAYLGLKAGNPGCTVLPGAVCMNTRGFYDEGMAANDLAFYGDVFNLHIYLAPAGFPSAFDDLRAFMARAGIAGREVWITENGMDLEGPAAEPDADHPEIREHSKAQAMLQAEYYAKSQIAMMMGGISRGYFFFFGAYNERNGSKSWGVFRRDGTPKPVCAAMATAIRELGGAELLGEAGLGKGLRGYLFAREDGSRTLAFWRESPVDTGSGRMMDPKIAKTAFELRGCSGKCRLTDLFGTSEWIRPEDGRPLELSATRYPSFLRGDIDLPVRKAAYPNGRRGATPAPDGTDLSVVFRVDLDKDDFRIMRGKTLAEMVPPKGRLTVQAWNLSDTAKTGTVAAAGCRMAGIPAEVVLPPFGKAEFPAVLTMLPGTAEAELRLTGVFNGKGTTALAMPVVHLDEAFLAKCRIVELAASTAPSRWVRHDSAARFSCERDEAQNAIRFHYEWDDPEADRWFYPECRLALPGEALDDAVMLEFEVKSVQDKVENDYQQANLILREGSFLGYPPPMSEWEVRRIPVGGVNPSATSFALGANPKGMKVDFLIRNLRLIKAMPGKSPMPPQDSRPCEEKKKEIP